MADPGCAWVLDSGGAGRGAWQGGVLHELMAWTRQHGGYPLVSMGASAGGYAAADVATGTERTVMKGWTAWGLDAAAEAHAAAATDPALGRNRFRHHLHASVTYVMADAELDGIFDERVGRKLVVFTTRAKRRDGRPIGRADARRLLLAAVTRKLPRALKLLPSGLELEPVVFATHLPAHLCSDHVRPLTRANFRAVVEASCLVPIAMGPPLAPSALVPDGGAVAGDEGAVFIDGGYALKMPMRLLRSDARLRALGEWAATPRVIVFCCDPRGRLWETSLRLQSLEQDPEVARAIAQRRLLVIHPDHEVEAGFLCLDNDRIMRTFARGQEQGRRLLASEAVRRVLRGTEP